MKNNKDLFAEAIADAKAVKTMAIANAKLALEESFTPHLTKMFTSKLQEMEETENKEVNEVETTVEENEIESTTNEDINLDELLAELDNSEEIDEEINLNEVEKDKKDEDKEDDKEESEEEEFKVEDMSEEDLKSFVEDVIKDMTQAGEIEAGHEVEGEEEAEENEEVEDEVNLEEILEELGLNEKHSYTKKVKDFSKGAKDEHVTDNTEVDDPAYTKSQANKISFKEELNKAIETISTLKNEINEVNLLNAKLLYTNKIFKAKNLTESQKVKVLNSFDKAKTVTESKLVYETILESLKEKKPVSTVNESLGRASKATGISTINKNQPILEVNDAYNRMQILAGLK